MSRLRRLCLSFLAAALAATAFASTAAAATPLEIAVQDDGVLLKGGDAERAQAWERIRQMRTSWVRVNLYWNDVVSSPTAKRVPKRIRYTLGQFDRLVSEARASRVRVQMTLGTSAPAWATSTRRVGKTNPNPRLFARFAGDMARHFKGRVGRYSILNEPNLIYWLNPVKTSAAQYRKLYPLAYRAVKRADSRAKVFFGETAPFTRSKKKGTDPITWIRRVLKGARLKADGVAHHPYAYRTAPTKSFGSRNSVTMGTLPRLNKLLKSAAKRRELRTPAGKVPGIYLTEHGYFVDGPAAPSFRRRNALPAATRARFWRQSLQVARRTSNVRQLLAYQLYPSAPTATWDTSILDVAGNPTPPFSSIVAWVNGASGAVAQPR